MHEYRDYLRNEEQPKTFLGLSSVTHILIAANVALFFAYLFTVHIILPYAFQVKIGDHALRYVGVIPERAVGGNPPWLWQLVTYGFFHSTNNPFHIFFNMINLYFFGREVETLYGPKRFLFLYVASLIFGALAYCLFNYSNAGPLIGASGAVYAIMVTYAIHYPRQRVLFLLLVPLEIWVIVAGLIAVDVIVQVRGAADYGAMAHIGGAIFGYLFWRLQPRFDAYMARLDRRMQRAEREHEEEIEARLDTLLEKISREGIDALSRKERDFLKRASRHYQKKP